MKKFTFVVLITMLVVFNYTVSAYANSYYLDPSFGENGLVLFETSNIDYQLRAMAIQSDGKMLVTGQAKAASDADILLIRYNANGSLDEAFGDQGVVLTNIVSSMYEAGNDIVLQPDGKVLVTGIANNNFVVVRFLANGLLDTAFGNDGVVTTDFDGALAYPHKILLQNNGQIVILGQVTGDLAIARYHTNGQQDISFGDAGLSIVDAGGFDEGYDLVRLDDGRFLLLATTTSTIQACADCDVVTTSDIVLVLLTATGNLDVSFAASGYKYFDFAENDWGHYLNKTSTGDVYVLGSVLLKINTAGELQGGFGNNGVVEFENFTPTGLVTQHDRLIVSGNTQVSDNQNCAVKFYNTADGFPVDLAGDDYMIDIDNSSTDYSVAIDNYTNSGFVVGGWFNNMNEDSLFLIKYNYLTTTAPNEDPNSMDTALEENTSTSQNEEVQNANMTQASTGCALANKDAAKHNNYFWLYAVGLIILINHGRLLSVVSCNKKVKQ